jgi:hypothetical protein
MFQKVQNILRERRLKEKWSRKLVPQKSGHIYYGWVEVPKKFGHNVKLVKV